MSQIEQSRTRLNSPIPLVAAAVFLVAYLLVGPLAGPLADRDLPLPDAAAADIAAFYAANPTAALVGATLQLISVIGLLVFAQMIAAGSRPTAFARIAVGAMVVSCLLTGVVTVVAGDVADQTVALLRQAGFYAGGVVHVVTLGIFSLLAASMLHRRGLVGKGVRTFGYVAGAIAVLAVLSVAIYYANALLPLGRLLCMVWAVTVGVSLWRRRP